MLITENPIPSQYLIFKENYPKKNSNFSAYVASNGQIREQKMSKKLPPFRHTKSFLKASQYRAITIKRKMKGPMIDCPVMTLPQFYC